MTENIYLEKAERSRELNNINRILIDIKTIIEDDKFVIYKIDDVIYYVFNNLGLLVAEKHDGFFKMESEFLKNGEYLKLDTIKLKEVAVMKKRDFTEIYYNDTEFVFEYLIDEVPGKYVVKKIIDTDEIMLKFINRFKAKKDSEEYKEATYDRDKELIISEGKEYPYKITFSDDINFKMKTNQDDNVYKIRFLEDGSFMETVTKTVFEEDKFKNKLSLYSTVFVFNFYKAREGVYHEDSSGLPS